MITREEFDNERTERLSEPKEWLQLSARRFEEQAVRDKYFYNFQWMGLPIIQFPQDLIALQHIIWHTQPEAIIETGLAWGGSAAFYGSCLGQTPGEKLVVSIEKKVLQGVEDDVEIRMPENVSSVIIEASSVTEAPLRYMEVLPKFGAMKKMVCLDSRHTKAHVAEELRLYADMVSVGCYLVVFDTFVADMPMELYKDHDCSPLDSPAQAVEEFLARDGRFVVDVRIDRMLQISSNHRGYLKKIKA